MVAAVNAAGQQEPAHQAGSVDSVRALVDIIKKEEINVLVDLDTRVKACCVCHCNLLRSQPLLGAGNHT